MSIRLRHEQLAQPHAQLQVQQPPLVCGMSKAAELELPVATPPTGGPAGEFMVKLVKQGLRN